MYDQCILLVLIFKGETLTLTLTSAPKLKIVQRKIERSLLGASLSGDHEETSVAEEGHPIVEPTTWKGGSNLVRIEDDVEQ